MIRTVRIGRWSSLAKMVIRYATSNNLPELYCMSCIELIDLCLELCRKIQEDRDPKPPMLFLSVSGRM